MKTAALTVAIFTAALSGAVAGSYTVLFDGNGGSGSMSAKTFTTGTSTALSANSFSKAGYSFGGWATAPDGLVVYANSQSVKDIAQDGESITLYAVWNANAYNIAFNANGGVGAMPSQTYTYDAAPVPLPWNKFTYKGHVFKGWSTTAKGEVVFADAEAVANLAASGTITLYAVWESNGFTVAFNANGGLGAMAEQDFALGTPAALSKNTFSNPGFVFMGWGVAAAKEKVVFKNGETVSDLASTGTITLYAVWESVSFTIVFDANGGLGVMVDQDFTLGTPAPLSKNAFKKSGCAFKGWSTTAKGEVVFKDGEKVSDLAASGTVKLYAVWESTSNTIVFLANGGTGFMPVQVLKGDTVEELEANAFVRDGYVFAGWSKTKTGGVAYTDGQKVKKVSATAGNVFLYAVWAKKKFSVTFDANGGSGSMAKEGFTYGKAKKLAACKFKRSGYVFMGWAKSKAKAKAFSVAYANKQKVKNLTITGGTVKLYAVWAKKSYKVAFNANGGMGKMAKEKMAYGTVKKLAACKFKRTDYAFMGWATSKARAKKGVVDYANKQKVKNLTPKGGTVTLYAVWKKK